VNTHRPGYPLYSSWLASHSQCQNFRRFKTTRMRLLLAKQDEVSKLESELKAIDWDETAELFLGSMRLDKNAKRKDVMCKLDVAIKEYDELLLRSRDILNMPDSSIHNLHVMDTWLRTTGCIARSEFEYVKAEDWDIVNICGIGHAVRRDDSLLTTRITNALGELRKNWKMVCICPTRSFAGC
ncbi:uncharacterized protein BDR25DRAFT_230846, partial [Lindgomyces ingoldianus]